MSDELDPEQEQAALEAAAAKAALERRQQLDDLALLMRDQAGRRVLRRLIERCGPLRLGWDADSERMSSLRAGERNVGLWLIAEMTEASAEQVGDLLIAAKAKQS